MRIHGNVGSEAVHKHDTVHVDDAVIVGKVTLGRNGDVVSRMIHLISIIIFNHIHHMIVIDGEPQEGYNSQRFRPIGVITV